MSPNRMTLLALICGPFLAATSGVCSGDEAADKAATGTAESVATNQGDGAAASKGDGATAVSQGDGAAAIRGDGATAVSQGDGAAAIRGDSAATSKGDGAVTSEGISGQQEPTEEVVIAAQREKLSALRREIEKAEDTFYEAYNRVNTVPEYQTHCGIATPVDSHVARRVCTPKFVETAREAEASAFLSSFTTLTGAPVVPADATINSKMRPYKKHVVDVVAKDPHLLKMLRDYDALTKHYQAVRRQKLKGKWIYWGD